MTFILQPVLAVLTAFSLAAAFPILRRIYQQWSLRKIPGPPSASLISGEFSDTDVSHAT